MKQSRRKDVLLDLSKSAPDIPLPAKERQACLAFYKCLAPETMLGGDSHL
jgi:hypothetical protein